MEGRGGSGSGGGVRGSGRVRVLAPISGYLARFGRKLDPFVRQAYSQDGEDLILMRIFEGKGSGFYVDVGAHHPFRFSNTCVFYQQGWRGINIDADPSAMAEFAHHRRRDINVCSGVGLSPGTIDFHFFNEPALNTFDKDLANERAQMNGYRIISTQAVGVLPLSAILEKHLPQGQMIDFMTIDVEGLDLAVLQSNDWARFRPRVLLVEARGIGLDAVNGDPSCDFVRRLNYRPIAKTVNTVFFESPA